MQSVESSDGPVEVRQDRETGLNNPKEEMSEEREPEQREPNKQTTEAGGTKPRATPRMTIDVGYAGETRSVRFAANGDTDPVYSVSTQARRGPNETIWHEYDIWAVPNGLYRVVDTCRQRCEGGRDHIGVSEVLSANQVSKRYPVLASHFRSDDAVEDLADVDSAETWHDLE